MIKIRRALAVLLAICMLSTALITALAAWEEDTETAPVVVEKDENGNITNGEVPSGTEGIDEWRLVDTDVDENKGTEIIVNEDGEEAEVIEYDEDGNPIIGYLQDNDAPIYIYFDENGDPIDAEEVEVIVGEDGSIIVIVGEGIDESQPIYGYNEDGTPITEAPVTRTYQEGASRLEDENGDPILDDEGNEIWKVFVRTDEVEIPGEEKKVYPGWEEEGNSSDGAEDRAKINGGVDQKKLDDLKENYNIQITGSGQSLSVYIPEGLTVVIRHHNGGSSPYVYEYVTGEQTYRPEDASGSNVWIVGTPIEGYIQGYDQVEVYDDATYTDTPDEPIDYVKVPVYGRYEIEGYENGEPILGSRKIIGYYYIAKETYARYIWVSELGIVTEIETGEEFTEEEFVDIVEDLIPVEDIIFVPLTEDEEEIIVTIDEPTTPLTETPLVETPANEEEENEIVAAPAIIDIDDPEVPLIDIGNANSWHLWNLILSIATIVLALAMGIRAIAGNKKKDEYEENAKSSQDGGKDARKKNIVLSLLVPVAAIAACIMFVLTQDMSAPMAQVDSWTAAHAGIFAAGLISFIFADRKVKDEEQEVRA